MFHGGICFNDTHLNLALQANEVTLRRTRFSVLLNKNPKWWDAISKRPQALERLKLVLLRPYPTSVRSSLSWQCERYVFYRDKGTHADGRRLEEILDLLDTHTQVCEKLNDKFPIRLDRKRFSPFCDIKKKAIVYDQAWEI